MADLDLYTEKSSLVSFADNTQSWVVADTEEECKRITKEEANKVINFFCANSVRYSIIVTKQLCFTTQIE